MSNSTTETYYFVKYNDFVCARPQNMGLCKERDDNVFKFTAFEVKMDLYYDDLVSKQKEWEQNVIRSIAERHARNQENLLRKSIKNHNNKAFNRTINHKFNQRNLNYRRR